MRSLVISAGLAENDSTAKRKDERGGKEGDEAEGTRSERERDMQSANRHTCPAWLSGWDSRWFEAARSSLNPLLSRCICIVWSGRGLCFVCVHNCVLASLCQRTIVCVCIWCKVLHCAQSGAPILSQWARAKVVNDPDLTRPLPLCQCMCVRMCVCVCVWVPAMLCPLYCCDFK